MSKRQFIFNVAMVAAIIGLFAGLVIVTCELARTQAVAAKNTQTLEVHLDIMSALADAEEG